MGYQINCTKKRRDGSFGWELKWQKDLGSGKREQRHVSKKSTEFRELGFQIELTLEEARARAKQLSAERQLQLHTERIGRLEKKLKQNSLIRSAFLPKELVKEFEATILVDKRFRRSHWETAKKIVGAIDVHPSKWYARPAVLYTQFTKRGFSPDYSNRLLRLLNAWGWFLCDSTNRAWKDVPRPRGFELQLIKRAYLKKTPGGRVAKPLTPEVIHAAKDRLEEPNFNWLYVSIWFGLRPREINNLLTDDENLWWIDTSDQRFTILNVYQQKLQEEGISESRCWKAIPALLPEQKKAIEIILSKNFRKPSPKVLRKHLPTGIKPYSGRKNFNIMLRQLGYDQECRQKWMGHLSMQTAMEHYDDPRIVTYRPPVDVKKAQSEILRYPIQ